MSNGRIVNLEHSTYEVLNIRERKEIELSV